MDVRERPDVLVTGGRMLGGSPPQRTASGDQSAMEPPGPIPNPEVKRCRADGSWAKGPARVGRCQLYARLFRKKKPGVFFYEQSGPGSRGGRLAIFEIEVACPGGSPLRFFYQNGDGASLRPRTKESSSSAFGHMFATLFLAEVFY